jgi:hypothetical protein
MEVKMKNESEQEVIDCMAYNGYGGVKIEQFTLKIGREDENTQKSATHVLPTLESEVLTASPGHVINNLTILSSGSSILKTSYISSVILWLIVVAILKSFEM